jgi:hypothetical protein
MHHGQLIEAEVVESQLHPTAQQIPLVRDGGGGPGRSRFEGEEGVCPGCLASPEVSLMIDAGALPAEGPVLGTEDHDIDRVY